MQSGISQIRKDLYRRNKKHHSTERCFFLTISPNGSLCRSAQKRKSNDSFSIYLDLVEVTFLEAPKLREIDIT